MKMGVYVFFVCLFMNPMLAQKSLIQAGPMVSHVQLRDVALWLQTSEKGTVQYQYRIKGSKTSFQKSKGAKSTENNHFITTIHITDIEPGMTYEYIVLVNKKPVILPFECSFTTQAHWQYRADPPNFSFVAGSCTYVNETPYDRPGKPYGSNFQIFTKIDSIRPDFMLWLGDNTYLREGDFESREGIFRRQSHTRSLAEMRPLMAHTPNYAIWDDHDYGSNDSDRTFRLKKHSLEAFKQFWPAQSYHTNGLEGITHSFVYNDCEFFMLDDRWYKSPDTTATILGQTQIEWLKDALLSSRASIKFIVVGGQFLSDFRGYENFANYANDQKEIIAFIDKHKIKNIIFLTGDRHHSELTKFITPNGIVIYDVTSSALTSSTGDHSSEPNSRRISGKTFGVNNFALINVKGDRKNRTVSMKFIDADGKELYQYTF